MFESLSDSSHANDGQDSFTTSSSSARQAMKKQQLKELNNELIKENSLLRSQFEEAVEITAQFQDLHQKNQQLLLQIGQLQAEKEDLDHRLEISLATNRELTKRLTDEKKNHTQQNDTNINAMNNEIEKVRDQAKAQLDSVLEELEKVKSIHEKDVLQQKTIVGRLDRVLQSGERYFNKKLSTVDDLILLFEKPQIQNGKIQTSDPVSSAQAPISFASNVNNDALEKKVKHLKSKLRATSHEKDDLEAQLSKLQREASELRNEYSSQIADLQRKVSSINSDKVNLEEQSAAKISSLERQVDQLNKDLAMARSSPFAQIPHPVQPTNSQSVDLRSTHSDNLPKVAKRQSLPEDIDKINNLTQQIDDLSERIKKHENTIADQSKKLATADTTNLQLKMQIENMKTELSTLNSLKDSSAAEIETLRNALHTKQAAINEPIQIPRPPPNVIKYQRAIEDQKQKILALTQQNDKQKKQIEKQDHDLANLRDKLEESNSQIRHISDEFSDYRSKVESKKPLTIEDILPSDAFRCAEFDSQLSTCIQKIATNPSLQPATKIQSCFRAIYGHLSNSLRELQVALDETTKENQFLSSSFNKFIIDLSIALCDQPTTIEDFFKSNGGEKLLQAVADFRVKFDDMKHQSDRLQQIVSHLDQLFPTGIDDPVMQITELKNQYQAQCDAIASKTSNVKRLRRELRELAQSNELLKSDSSQRIEDLTNRLSQATASVTQLERSNETLKKENSRMSAELLEANKNLAAGEEHFRKRQEDDINRLISENNCKYSDLSSKYNHLHQTYSEMVDEYNLQGERVANLESQIDNQKRQLIAKDREVNEFKKQLSDQADHFERRLEDEKRQLTETYKGAIAELTDQCAKHRSDVERMAKSVAENEKQMAISRNECNLMKKHKIKIENEMKSLNAKVERERKLMETNYTAKRIAYESETAQKMNEERQKLEQEKRRICGFGVEAFKMFFNANSSIDEKSFRNVIENARDELTRLTKSDAAVRRIVAARDNQTTEDAVAQVLMASP
ncbi:hypothetical protein M9Y10_013670 [Tritrichomonas musculus]|uniref:Viral A-type inclusion protein n=1 Tax=Tritrichomonas musculus TaxID=1915356 RepID=A0ABR2KXH6_9EUKA